MKLGFFTGTRADFGLLSGTVQYLISNSDIDVGFIVGGSHFSKTLGFSINEVRSTGLPVWSELDVGPLPTTEQDVALFSSRSMAQGADALAQLNLDAICILGDRYEALAMAQSAFFLHVPVIHIHAGERTEGAQDNAIRHAITQLSQFAVVACEEYENRCLQLGFSTERVFNLGAPGLDVLTRSKLKSREDFCRDVGLPPDSPFFLVTVHPETVQPENTAPLIENCIAALKQFPTFNMLVTYPNADAGHQQIIDAIELWREEESNRVFLHANLGFARYHNALKYCDLVIGNSSSGIIEAPSYHVPTVNIGRRQFGRACARSVVTSEPNEKAIVEAISQVQTPEFQHVLDNVNNPYGMPGFAQRFCDFIGSVQSKLAISRSFSDYKVYK